MMTAAAVPGKTGNAPAVSVVVPTRDRPGPLARCLGALEAQTVASFEIIVVDDGSGDPAMAARVMRGAPHALLLRGDGAGPAAARNLGVSRARGRVICFTDDDCRPVPGWLQAMAARVEAGASAVAGPMRAGDLGGPYAVASQTITNHLTDSSADQHGAVAFAPTSNLACVAELCRSVPFDEGFPLPAGEDRDWCERLASQGVNIAWEPTALVWHDQDLVLREFWRQHVRYGRGTRRLHRGRQGRARLQPGGFYAGLVRKGLSQGLAVGSLVVLAQVATAAGVVREALVQGRGQCRAA